MNHNLFKPQNIEDAKNCVVGDCNGYSMEDRYRLETPLFAKEIIKNCNGSLILDYGTGVGRLAKEILTQSQNLTVIGTDASKEMMSLAIKNVENKNFSTKKPQDITETFDLIYCVYVLQHVPAIEIREILQRIYHHLKDDGIFIYCSSDYRMAINFENPGFFSDNFLGVNLREEVERYFDKVGPLFSEKEFKDNEILRKMVLGEGNNLPHPAFVYKKKKLVGQLFNAIEERKEGYLTKEESKQIEEHSKEVFPREKIDLNSFGKKEYTKLILCNRLAPGDILVSTNALRDLHKAYPGKYQTEMRTPCNVIFENNPYYTKLSYDENEYQKFERELHKGDKNGATFVLGEDILVIDLHYPIIHTSGEVGQHFGYGHTEWLEEVLEVKIPKTSIRPEIYLSQTEREWLSPVLVTTGYDKPYWVINAGSKGDYTLKQYPQYQGVVDLLKDKVKFVQIGLRGHNHIPLNGVIDMVGKTDDRKLYRIINGALGVLTCVSYPMHIAAAFSKPCVVVAGGREGTRWELYPNQQFLYVNGCLPCAPYDGCWKSKFEDCTNKVDNIAKCMTMITPHDIVRSIERYYQGGILSY